MSNENYMKISNASLALVAKYLDRSADFLGYSGKFFWEDESLLPDVFAGLENRFNLIVDDLCLKFSEQAKRARNSIRVEAIRYGSDEDSKICGLKAYLDYFPMGALKESRISATWNDEKSTWELDIKA